MEKRIDVKKYLSELAPKNFFVLLAAGIINAFGVTIFLFPVKLYDSGISGLSMLLDQITSDNLKLSLFLIVLNIPIFLFGYRRQGSAFTIYSIFTVAVYSIMSFLIMNVLPILICLLLAALRKGGIKCRVEFFYKISKWIAENT